MAAGPARAPRGRPQPSGVRILQRRMCAGRRRRRGGGAGGLPRRRAARGDPELLWFQSRPGQPGWAEHSIARLGRETTDPHDIQPISVRRPSGELLRGVLVLLDRRQLVWFQIPADPRAPWPRRTIATFPGLQQSGMAIGEIAGRGRADVVCGQFWLECPADPAREPWALHRFGDWQDGGWGGMLKHGLADLDGDGRLEIVAAEAEIPDARLGVFRRVPGKPEGLWQCHQIAKGLYCPHSLVVADVDRDGRTDVIVGEMTAGGWDFPLNRSPKIFAYRNRVRSGSTVGPCRRVGACTRWGSRRTVATGGCSSSPPMRTSPTSSPPWRRTSAPG